MKLNQFPMFDKMQLHLGMYVIFKKITNLGIDLFQVENYITVGNIDNGFYHLLVNRRSDDHFY